MSRRATMVRRKSVAQARRAPQVLHLLCRPKIMKSIPYKTENWAYHLRRLILLRMLASSASYFIDSAEISAGSTVDRSAPRCSVGCTRTGARPFNETAVS